MTSNRKFVPYVNAFFSSYISMIHVRQLERQFLYSGYLPSKALLTAKISCIKNSSGTAINIS